MTTVRRFCCNDLLRISTLLIDRQNETKNHWRYATHLAVWTNCFLVATSPGNRVMGYIIGHVRGKDLHKSCHINSVTLSAHYHKTNVVKKLMSRLEDIIDNIEKAYTMTAWTLPLSTRITKGYEKLGFVIYRRLLFKHGEEERIELKKSLPTLSALTKYLESIQQSPANVEGGMPYQDMTSWPSADDDGMEWASDDDDETSVPYAGGEPSMPSLDVTSVLAAEGSDVTSVPYEGGGPSVPSQDATSVLAAEGGDVTNVPYEGGGPSVPSQDATSVLAAEGGDVTNVPSAGDC